MICMRLPLAPVKSTLHRRAECVECLFYRRSKVPLETPAEVKAVAQALKAIRTAAEVDASGAAALLSRAQARAQT